MENLSNNLISDTELMKICHTPYLLKDGRRAIADEVMRRALARPGAEIADAMLNDRGKIEQRL